MYTGTDTLLKSFPIQSLMIAQIDILFAGSLSQGSSSRSKGSPYSSRLLSVSSILPEECEPEGFFLYEVLVSFSTASKNCAYSVSPILDSSGSTSDESNWSFVSWLLFGAMKEAVRDFERHDSLMMYSLGSISSSLAASCSVNSNKRLLICLIWMRLFSCWVTNSLPVCKI